MSVTLRWKAMPWHKNLWCRLFGHVWKSGWYGDKPYLRQTYKALSNLNTLHLKLECDCDRCGESHEVGYTHHREKETFLSWLKK